MKTFIVSMIFCFCIINNAYSSSLYGSDSDNEESLEDEYAKSLSDQVGTEIAAKIVTDVADKLEAEDDDWLSRAFKTATNIAKTGCKVMGGDDKEFTADEYDAYLKMKFHQLADQVGAENAKKIFTNLAQEVDRDWLTAALGAAKVGCSLMNGDEVQETLEDGYAKTLSDQVGAEVAAKIVTDVADKLEDDGWLSRAFKTAENVAKTGCKVIGGDDKEFTADEYDAYLKMKFHQLADQVGAENAKKIFTNLAQEVDRDWLTAALGAAKMGCSLMNGDEIAANQLYSAVVESELNKLSDKLGKDEAAQFVHDMAAKLKADGWKQWLKQLAKVGKKAAKAACKVAGYGDNSAVLEWKLLELRDQFGEVNAARIVNDMAEQVADKINWKKVGRFAAKVGCKLLGA